ncbi:DedA family protein [Streptomyces sp. 7G]|uniref:DedA family protein n=1 Tax=Streptomyces sp. 7G TaxID=2877241 RepID=UPI001CD36C8B|nr:DedA family protein [Streptomyces sp. 7G]MCA1273226.1 DedA family protein [Streptomyces sp. 7G]
MFSSLLDWLQASPQPVVLAGAGLVAFGEAIVGIGLFLPGEAAMLIAASTVDSFPKFMLLWAVAIICSVAGNIVGFELGRRVGPGLRETKLIRKRGAEGWDKATELLRKRGTWAIFVGRLIPLVRGFVPPVAGVAGVSYRTFLPPIVAGAVISTVLPLLFALGVLASLGSVGGIAAVVGLMLLIAAIIIIRRRLRLRQSQDTAPGPESSPSTAEVAATHEPR